MYGGNDDVQNIPTYYTPISLLKNLINSVFNFFVIKKNKLKREFLGTLHL